MDKGQLETIIHSGKPFEIETAAGRTYRVEHQDYVSFSPKKTTLIISHLDSEGEETFSVVPLLTITSAAIGSLPAGK